MFQDRRGLAEQIAEERPFGEGLGERADGFLARVQPRGHLTPPLLPVLCREHQEDLFAGPEIPDDIGLGEPHGIGDAAERYAPYSVFQCKTAGGRENGLAPLLLLLRSARPEETLW